MEYHQMAQTQQVILCCQCGVAIPPNSANMCVDCIRNSIDITDGIPKQAIIHYCRGCDRYLQPPTHWVQCQLESRELLTICLKKMKGLGKVRLIDAGFIWTEPHSRRIKVKLTIQKEVFADTILQQVFVVEFVVQNQQCENCQRRMANDNWKAVVQVRQKVDHKKTFYFLEQLILKHRAHEKTINIKERPDGLDFYYSSKTDAAKMLDFFQAVVPLRYKKSERMISHDIHSNTFNTKFTFSVELVPICKDDLVCLPPKLARAQGNIAQLCLCYRVGNSVHLIDPNTLQVTEISSAKYWQFEFRSLSSQKQLVEYTVLDMDLLGPTRGKYALADVQLARSRDLGVNDTTFYSRTHLGYLIKPGDTVMGFDMAYMNVNDEHANNLQRESMPDVILVKKVFPRIKRKRVWRVKQLNKEPEGYSKREEEVAALDFENFLQDLEEDKDLRSAINIYKDPTADEVTLAAQAVRAAETGMDVGLEELLEDLRLDDAHAPPDTLPTLPPAAVAGDGAAGDDGDQMVID